MRIVITGGCGFLGMRLATALAARRHLCGQTVAQLHLLDIAAPPFAPPPFAQFHQGDISDAAALVASLPPGPLTVFHLASVVSAGGEQDFDGALATNLDGGRLLLQALRQRGDAPRLLFASSVAIFSGDEMGDDTKPLPATTYGMTKAVLELLINDMSRKGFIDGRTARLPTVIIRPGKPNAAASGFASGLFREPLNGIDYHLPVPRDTAILVAGYGSVIDNLITLAEVPAAQLALDRAVTFPSLRVTAAEMLAALELVAIDRPLAKISDAPDETITRIVRAWPTKARFDRALTLGLTQDSSLDAILARYISDYLPPL